MTAKEQIKYSGDPKRDMNKVLICDFCKTKFHPKKTPVLPDFVPKNVPEEEDGVPSVPSV